MSQRATLLAMLRERGEQGVGAREMIYQRGVTRTAAIIHELRLEGLNIETRNGDGPLAVYVLHRSQNVLRDPVSPPRVTLDPLPPAEPLVFACGCIRSADGTRWETRCEQHPEPVAERTRP